MALLPVPAALAITARRSARSAPDRRRRCFRRGRVRRGLCPPLRSARGAHLGMVAFHGLLLHPCICGASLSELPWMIGAVLVGTLCTYLISYVMPDRPETRCLRATISGPCGRGMAIVGRHPPARRGADGPPRRTGAGAGFSGAGSPGSMPPPMMVQGQIEGQRGPRTTLWPGVTGEPPLAPVAVRRRARRRVGDGRRPAWRRRLGPENTLGHAARAGRCAVPALLGPSESRKPARTGTGPRAGLSRFLDNQPIATADEDPSDAAVRPGGVVDHRRGASDCRSPGAGGAGNPPTAGTRRRAHHRARVRMRRRQHLLSPPTPPAEQTQQWPATDHPGRPSRCPSPASLAIITGELVSAPPRWYWGGDRGVRDLRRHQFLGRDPDPRAGSACSARCSGVPAGMLVADAWSPGTRSGRSR